MRRLLLLVVAGLAAAGIALAAPASASAAVRPLTSAPPHVMSEAAVRLSPIAPVGPSSPGAPSPDALTVKLPEQPSTVVQIILLTTVLGVAPAVLLMCTAFTKIVVVLSLTRSALGTPTVPPNQVLVGLALFLSLFVMGPTFDAMQSQGVRPYMDGTKTATASYRDATVPLREFMLKHTRDQELALMTKAADQPLPERREDVELRTLIPSFVLSELRGAFIIGFVVFVPFLVVDVVVSAVLMSLGMVMLPPSLVSLPFKLLLFVLVDGWSLIVTTLLGSYR
jgi:flagellar biosynthetic protein FliP